MPTEIHFAGGDRSLRVDAEPGEVLDALAAAKGLPFRLTILGSGVEVYVNPDAIVFWHHWERYEGGPPEFRDPPPSPPR